MREEFGDDYLIINGAIFLSEIKTYLLRSCLCTATNTDAKSVTKSISFGSQADLAFTFTTDTETLAQGSTAALFQLRVGA